MPKICSVIPILLLMAGPAYAADIRAVDVLFLELKALIKCSNGDVVGGDYPARCSDGDGDFTTPAINTNLFSNFPNTWFWTSASTTAPTVRILVNPRCVCVECGREFRP